MSSRQPIKFSDLDINYMESGRLLNKHFCEKNQIFPMRYQKLPITCITCPIISQFSLFPLCLWKICCNSNQSSYTTGTKKTLSSVPSHIKMLYVKYEKKSASWLQRSRLKMLTPDGQWMHVYTISSPMSLRL